jgi:hypothetical protein
MAPTCTSGEYRAIAWTLRSDLGQATIDSIVFKAVGDPSERMHKTLKSHVISLKCFLIGSLLAQSKI